MTEPAGAPPLLQVEHLSMRFGGLVAVDDLSFTAQPHEITALPLQAGHAAPGFRILAGHAAIEDVLALAAPLDAEFMPAGRQGWDHSVDVAGDDQIRPDLDLTGAPGINEDVSELAREPFGCTDVERAWHPLATSAYTYVRPAAERLTVNGDGQVVRLR